VGVAVWRGALSRVVGGATRPGVAGLFLACDGHLVTDVRLDGQPVDEILTDGYRTARR